jgi:outer membrane lipoprotein-sorting protein
MIKKTIIALVLLIAMAGFAVSQDAVSVVEKSRKRIEASSVQTRSKMVITEKNGKTSERAMIQYSKDDSGGNNRSVVVFGSPASVAGTRFLTIENAGKNDDRWIFLPAQGKVRRIDSKGGSGRFVETDFSYDDISSQDRNTDLDNHKIVREDKVNGKDCYVIESTPKDSGYQYSKMVQYIDKSNFVNYKVELYDKKGVQVKLLEILELKEIQGRLTPMVTKMSTLSEKTSTAINIEAIKYDDEIPEGVFTPDFLATGRPR